MLVTRVNPPGGGSVIATIKDIARELGVDHSTVSLALADNQRITPATRERVRRAAEQLGYVPNRAARALRRGRTQTIAFVVWGNNPEQLRQSFPDYTVAATAAAFTAGYELLLLQATAERLAHTSIDRFPELRQSDGALFVGETLDRPGLATLIRAGYPLVHLGERTLAGVTLPCVSADYAQGGRLAADYLLAHGHRRLAVLYGSHPHAPEITERRLSGFAAAAHAAVLEYVAVDRETPIEPVLTALRARAVTAVFATEQVIGLRLLAACHDAGLAVPRELSLLVFDDLPSAALSSPPLTCIRQPREAVGRLGVELLRRLMVGETPELSRLLLPCTLVERASISDMARLG